MRCQVISTTEKPTRAACAEITDVDSSIVEGVGALNKFAEALILNLDTRLSQNTVVSKMKDVFHGWNTDALESLLSIANASGRNYGSLPVLEEQHLILKNRFKDAKGKEMEKWLAVCTNEKRYKDIPYILHYALCCFMKSPLEASAESIGSVINQHGRKDRYSLKPSSLSSEVQITWNGPEEFDPAVTSLLKEAMTQYFAENRYVERGFTLVPRSNFTAVHY